MLECIFHGHSFIEIKTETWSILIDPFITGNPKCDTAIDQIIDNQNILAICLTHGHGDHVGDTIEIANKTNCPIICMVELAHWLESKWVTTAIEWNIGWTIVQDRGKVQFVRADHSNSNPEWWYAGLAAGLILVIQWKTIYHAGDTAYFSDMQLLADKNVDLAFLPIWDKYTMGLDDALRTARDIKATTIVPIHYNTRPPIKADDMEFARQIMLNKYGVPKILRPGQGVVLE